jgi:broad specificity phosphatase PhoE
MLVPVPKRDFYFLRHGQTDWNAEGRFQGHSDIPLNALGLSQARDAALALARCPIDLVVASPLVRAARTAEIVNERLGKPIIFDDGLKERHFGALEGLVIRDVKAKLGMQPHERMLKHLPADAEQWHETGARTVRVLTTWLDRHPDQTLLFVAHGGLFDALHEKVFGARIEPKHAPYRWRHSGGAWICEDVTAEDPNADA